ncbi:unnamed protein product [Nesidiocoris tenuis]|uniref:Uncharacterized protein n=1 Tax=Nesidiocoris tenuis TaxID=355587 RepID=A0A6H5GJ37_9HEMI|nr:unnamed protein product [Nesidiocoris tenuis]
MLGSLGTVSSIGSSMLKKLAGAVSEVPLPKPATMTTVKTQAVVETKVIPVPSSATRGYDDDDDYLPQDRQEYLITKGFYRSSDRKTSYVELGLSPTFSNHMMNDGQINGLAGGSMASHSLKEDYLNQLDRAPSNSYYYNGTTETTSVSTAKIEEKEDPSKTGEAKYDDDQYEDQYGKYEDEDELYKNDSRYSTEDERKRYLDETDEYLSKQDSLDRDYSTRQDSLDLDRDYPSDVDRSYGKPSIEKGPETNGRGYLEAQASVDSYYDDELPPEDYDADSPVSVVDPSERGRGGLAKRGFDDEIMMDEPLHPPRPTMERRKLTPKERWHWAYNKIVHQLTNDILPEYYLPLHDVNCLQLSDRPAYDGNDLDFRIVWARTILLNKI